MNRPALFLDRDGVIIENRDDYVRSWADVELFPQAVEALAAIRHSPYRIVLVTNQSAVGRGYVTLETVESINDRLLTILREAGARVDSVYVCPHAPDDGCLCRKPSPGLLLLAAEGMGLDLSRSVMIGDALTDIQAGQAAGVGRTILVRTGRGRQQEELVPAAERGSFEIYDTLKDAIDSLNVALP